MVGAKEERQASYFSLVSMTDILSASDKYRNACSIMTTQSEGGRLIVKLPEESCEKKKSHFLQPET